MINRGTPKNVDDYILADVELTLDLHLNGFAPKYIDNNGTYFIKTKEILEFMERRTK